MSGGDLFADHRRAWATKPGLRHYYRDQIFARIAAEMRPGRSLELGAGPGFLASEMPGMVGIDIAPAAAAAVRCDAHHLPFADGAFTNAVGVDVLHHLERPGAALREIGRVLAPGGRLILAEPWTGALGFLFYRFVHHEDCRRVPSPWTQAFAPGKGPMEGNATIPRTVLWDLRDELPARAGLVVRRVAPFGALAYAATGGFQRFGLPAAAIAALSRIEGTLPDAALRALALRGLFVLERCSGATRT